MSNILGRQFALHENVTQGLKKKSNSTQLEFSPTIKTQGTQNKGHKGLIKIKDQFF